jgi:hypothetical protein
MGPGFDPQLAMFAVVGVVGGLWLLVRGMAGYRTAARIGDTGTSRIGTLAAGEVRISGVIEAAEVTLVSPLQSEPCVYYRATVDADEDGSLVDDLREERAVGFRVRDETGDIRVFPRGARWDPPERFDGRTSALGEAPAGLALRSGGAVAQPVDQLDREAAVAALLTVRRDADADRHPLLRGDGEGAGGLGIGLGGAGRRRHYREARLAPGDPVTILGRAMPFSDLSDPAEADIALGSEVPADDYEVNANIAEAREAGLLAGSPEAAWGNAAIAGFGIGRPVREPDLDPLARAVPLAPADEALRTERRFTIAPETLVLASAPDVPLLIAHGVPATAADRQQDRFIVGLLGAVLAIACALGLALMVSGASAP